MLSVDRVWARQAPRFPGARLGRDFNEQVTANSYSLTTGASTTGSPVNFAAHSIVYGILAWAHPTGQAATQLYRPGMDLFSVAIADQRGRSIAGPSEVIGSALFGPNGDLFPGLELYLPQATTLLYSFTNLTTSTITIYLTHHALVALS